MSLVNNLHKTNIPVHHSAQYRHWCNTVDALTVKRLAIYSSGHGDFADELRAIVRSRMNIDPHAGLTTSSSEQDIYTAVARLIWTGKLIVAQQHFYQPARYWLLTPGQAAITGRASEAGAQRVPQDHPQTPRPLPARPVMARHWAQLKFLQYTDGKAVAGVHVDITVPSGSEQPAATLRSNGQGRIEIHNLEAGLCKISSPARLLGTARTRHNTLSCAPPSPNGDNQNTADIPTGGQDYTLADVQAYEVRKGDTLATIAAAHGVTERELCQFNWSCTDREQIAQHLQRDMGAPPAAPGQQTVFSGAEDQPVLLIAKPWQGKQFSTQQFVDIQVAAVPAPARYFAIRLQDHHGNALTDIKYRLIIGTSDDDPGLEVFEGVSADGLIEHRYFNTCGSGVLQYWPHKDREQCVLRSLRLEQLAPPDTHVGQAQRLANLGYAVVAENEKHPQPANETDTALEIALQSYRMDQGLNQATGQEIADRIDNLA